MTRDTRPGRCVGTRRQALWDTGAGFTGLALSGLLEKDGFGVARGATASPLAEALFELEGVEAVLFGADHVSVVRSVSGPEWSEMKAPILGVIMDHFVSGAPLTRGQAADVDQHAEADSEIVAEIKSLSLNANRIGILVPKPGEVEHWTYVNGGGGWR